MPYPIISVIMPSYNHARFLTDAVNSVLGQTLSEIEVLIVDDCSTDGSQEVIRSFNDPRVRYKLLDMNRGACAALNIGLEMARSALIAVCNSDDMWVETKLESQLQILRSNTRVGAVFSNVFWIDERGKEMDRSQIPFFDVFAQHNRSRAGWLRTLVEDGNCLCHPSVLIRREVFGERGLYDLRYRQLPDLDMWLRTVEKYNLFIMPEKTVMFRRLDNNRNTAAVTPPNSTRTMNEASFILSDLFKRINVDNFESAFGTLKSPGDPDFCFPLEKVLYLISSGGPLEVVNKAIAHRLLFSYIKKPDFLLDLLNYRLPFDLFWQLTGLTSPWLDRQELGAYTDAEHQFLASLPQKTRRAAFANTASMSLPSSSQSGVEAATVRALNQEYVNLLNSTSWLVTKPIRKFKSVLLGPAAAGRPEDDLRLEATDEPASLPAADPTHNDDHLLEATDEPASLPAADPTHNDDRLLEATDEPASLPEAAQIQAEIDAIKNSLSWRLSSPLRVLKDWVSRAFSGSPSRSATAQKVKASAPEARLEATLSASGQGPDLAIFDDFFPCELSGFRYEEFCSLMEHFENSLVFTTGWSLPSVGLHPMDIYSLVNDFQNANPTFAGKVRIFNDSIVVRPKLAYCLFLSLADRYLPFFERHEIPFVFTLYPGGNLKMGDKDSEDMLRRVCSSKQFRGLITTQKTVSKYLKDMKVCGKDMITEVIGAVTPRQFEQTAWSEKRLFGKHKETIDICFVAHKYTDHGEDKGYDLFVQFAKQQAPDFPFLRFHVVGGFDDTVIGVSAIHDRITFHGNLNSDQMQGLFKSMDIILSPNDGLVRGGEMDGFPTACCMQAGMSGVAVFCTDQLRQNVLLKPDHDFVLIDRNVDSICRSVEQYLHNPDRLYDIAYRGQKRFRACFGWQSQLDARLAFINKSLSGIETPKSPDYSGEYLAGILSKETRLQPAAGDKI